MITIHGSIPSKKNSRQNIRLKTGRIISVPNSTFNKWHKKAMAEVMSLGMCGCQEGKKVCKVEINLYPPDKRRGDLTNRAESLMDLLVDCGIIKDDNWFEIPQIVLSFGGVDRSNPRAEIFLDIA
jgi:Holliday junction resolvase RusA-like endonuclease